MESYNFFGGSSDIRPQNILMIVFSKINPHLCTTTLPETNIFALKLDPWKFGDSELGKASFFRDNVAMLNFGKLPDGCSQVDAQCPSGAQCKQLSQADGCEGWGEIYPPNTTKRTAFRNQGFQWGLIIRYMALLREKPRVFIRALFY